MLEACAKRLQHISCLVFCSVNKLQLILRMEATLFDPKRCQEWTMTMGYLCQVARAYLLRVRC